MTAGRIVVVGSLNADLVVRVPRFPQPGETLSGSAFDRFPGGKGANQAYGAARLGGRVRMVGQVGADDHGRWLAGHLAQGGVDTAFVRAHPSEPTGVALITIDVSGQNTIVLVPGANGACTTDRLPDLEPALAEAAVVLLQLEIPLETVRAAASAARRAGAVVVLDPAPARELPDGLLQSADYVTPNETELALLTGGGAVAGESDVRARAESLLARGARAVVVKWGAHGARLVRRDRVHPWPAHAVPVVDTTAAGDAFNAAFAVRLAEGADPIEAGRFATAAAAVSVGRAGAQPSMPTREEAERLVSVSRQH